MYWVDTYAWMEPTIAAVAEQIPDPALGIRVHHTRTEDTKGSDTSLRGRTIRVDIVREAHASAGKVAIIGMYALSVFTLACLLRTSVWTRWIPVRRAQRRRRWPTRHRRWIWYLQGPLPPHRNIQVCPPLFSSRTR